MLATLEGPVYIERVSLDSPKNVITAKRAIMKAFRNQVDRKGFSFVEALSLCPTDWGMTSLHAAEWVRNSMIKHYPLGVYKDTGHGSGVTDQEDKDTA
jgi:2-oxoglutarate ferredoxin oxidoreductase subunit beta